MYLLARPPYLRWAVAALLVLAGLLVECGGAATTPHPFTTRIVPAGESLDLAVEWRDVPAGLLIAPDLDGAVAAMDLPAGTPVVDAVVATRPAVPEGWWAVALELPPTAVEGADVLVVLTSTGEQVPGIVVAAGGDGGFGIDEPGVVAVPEAMAAAVARGAAGRDVVVAVRP